MSAAATADVTRSRLTGDSVFVAVEAGVGVVERRATVDRRDTCGARLGAVGEVLRAGPGATMAYAKPDPANPTGEWKVHNISEPGLGGPNGMGVGDINGDGRMDVVNSRGWWEQPPSRTAEGLWKFHPVQFGNGGAEMGVYDVNGDGLNDVVTAIAARYGTKLVGSPLHGTAHSIHSQQK